MTDPKPGHFADTVAALEAARQARRARFESRYRSTYGKLNASECLECGALVSNTARHDEWHENLREDLAVREYADGR
jgi:hypothetical protein